MLLLILSGVNRGNNSAENALYSGTLGAAMEAALQGVPAMALSQYFGPANYKSDAPFDTATRHAPALVRKILAATPTEQADYRLFYNINFPPVLPDDVKGTRVVTQGFRRGSNFSVEPHFSPSGKRFVWIKGGNQQIMTEPGTDAAVNLDGYISVTPMRADLTAHDTLEALKGIE